MLLSPGRGCALKQSIVNKDRTYFRIEKQPYQLHFFTLQRTIFKLDLCSCMRSSFMLFFFHPASYLFAYFYHHLFIH